MFVYDVLNRVWKNHYNAVIFTNRLKIKLKNPFGAKYDIVGRNLKQSHKIRVYTFLF